MGRGKSTNLKIGMLLRIRVKIEWPQKPFAQTLLQNTYLL